MRLHDFSCRARLESFNERAKSLQRVVKEPSSDVGRSAEP
jgi:hypothetical protein